MPKEKKRTCLTEIRKYRFLNGEMTQEELGKKIGISRQAVCDIETGKKVASLKTARRIALLLDRSIEAIFFPGEKQR